MAAIRPSPLDLGTTYAGAILEGSFQVRPVNEIREIEPDRAGRDCFEVLRTDVHSGCGIVRFRIKTDHPRDLFAFLKVSTDAGEATTHVAARILPGPPPGGRVLFCEPPCHAYVDRGTIQNLNLVVRELELQLNSVFALPADLTPFGVVVLHGNGVHQLVQEDRTRLHQYLASGGRVVVFASHFFRGTVTWANHFTEAYGIVLDDREHKEVLCDDRHVEAHPITDGVKRLRWYRPSPITVSREAKLLVRNPDRPEEGFVACSGPLLVVGDSGLYGLLCVGWPFDNGRLFANLLRHSVVTPRYQG